MIYVGLSFHFSPFLNSPLHSFRSHVCIVRNLIDKRVLSNVLTCRNVSSTQKGRGTFHPRFRGPRALDGRMFDLETAQSPFPSSFRQHRWRMVETLDEGNQEGSFVEISSPLLAPSLSRDGNSLGGGILLPARAKVVPLSSRTTHATKIYLPLCPFPLYHSYTFAPRCTHLLLYSIPSNRFHIIWHVSSFLLVHAIRCKKVERIPSLFQSISKKLSVPHRIVFCFICGSDFIFFYPVWLNCARYVRALFDFVFLRFRMQSPT